MTFAEFSTFFGERFQGRTSHSKRPPAPPFGPTARVWAWLASSGEKRAESVTGTKRAAATAMDLSSPAPSSLFMLALDGWEILTASSIV